MPLDIRWKKSVLFTCILIVLIWMNSTFTKSGTTHFNGKSKDFNNATTYFNTRLQAPGVILRTTGGIGNQLFEYACCYALARDLNRTLYSFVTTSSLSPDRIFSAKERDFALDKFEIPLDNFIDRTTVIDSSHVTYLDDRELFFRNSSDNTFLQQSSTSYCQSEVYFFKYRHELRKLFEPKREEVDSPKIANIAKQIEESSESVAIHVRRGDFLAEIKYYIPISYQMNAIHRMSKLLKERRAASSPTFFVFTDDTVYVREKFESLLNFEFVFVSEATNTSIQDFYLMSKCKHFIIPNSTFSWWAAYLGTSRNKIVIASTFNPRFLADFEPGGAFASEFYLMSYGRSYHRKEWIVINPFVGEY